MRRMLDPTKVGGNNKIYLHCIQLYGGGIGNIFVSCYTTNAEKFTISSFTEFMKDKMLPCTGCISPSAEEKRVLMHLKYSNGNRFVEAWYYNPDNPSGYRPVSIKTMNIEDMVSQL